MISSPAPASMKTSKVSGPSNPCTSRPRRCHHEAFCITKPIMQIIAGALHLPLCTHGFAPAVLHPPSGQFALCVQAPLNRGHIVRKIR